jgi:hypothetical protein
MVLEGPKTPNKQVWMLHHTSGMVSWSQLSVLALKDRGLTSISSSIKVMLLPEMFRWVPQYRGPRLELGHGSKKNKNDGFALWIM